MIRRLAGDLDAFGCDEMGMQSQQASQTLRAANELLKSIGEKRVVLESRLMEECGYTVHTQTTPCYSVTWFREE